jgi:hypothetical protein
MLPFVVLWKAINILMTRYYNFPINQISPIIKKIKSCQFFVEIELLLIFYYCCDSLPLSFRKITL